MGLHFLGLVHMTDHTVQAPVKLCLCDFARTLVPVPKSTKCYWDVNLILFRLLLLLVFVVVLIGSGVFSFVLFFTFRSFHLYFMLLKFPFRLLRSFGPGPKGGRVLVMSPPIWNLRTIIWFHLSICCLVILPKPAAPSVFYFFFFWPSLLPTFQKFL